VLKGRSYREVARKRAGRESNTQPLIRDQRLFFNFSSNETSGPVSCIT
jgi:hypothetical protein